MRKKHENKNKEKRVRTLFRSWFTSPLHKYEIKKGSHLGFSLFHLGPGLFFFSFFPFLTFQRFSGGVGYLLFNGFSLDRGVYLAGSHWVVTAYGVFFSFLRFIISSLSTRVLFIHPCPVCFVCLRPISSSPSSPSSPASCQTRIGFHYYGTSISMFI